MNKLRLIMAILRTKNYIVITDDVDDGYVEPQHAHDFLELLQPICEHLKQLGREVTLKVMEGK